MAPTTHAVGRPLGVGVKQCLEMAIDEDDGMHEILFREVYWLETMASVQGSAGT